MSDTIKEDPRIKVFVLLLKYHEKPKKQRDEWFLTLSYEDQAIIRKEVKHKAEKLF